MYIGDLHKRAVYISLAATSPDSLSISSLDLPNHSSMSYFPRADDVDTAALDAESTRLGSRALFYSSILSLAVNLILPFFVAETSKRRTQNGLDTYEPSPTPFKNTPSSSWTPQIPAMLQIHLSSLWAMSHAVLAGCMLATL